MTPVPGTVAPSASKWVALLAQSVVHTKPARLPRGGVLAGPCVKPEQHATALASRANDVDIDEGFVRDQGGPDLDGDGVPDAIYFGGATGMDVLFLLYVKRGACAYLVGELVSDSELRPAETSTHGLSDLTGRSACASKCCRETHDYLWKFDGTAYVLTSDTSTQRTCGRQ